MEKTYHTVQLIRAAPGREARVDICQGIAKGRGLTEEFVAKLKALPPPDTKSGRRAKQLFASFAAKVHEPLDEVERHLRKLPERLSLIQSIRMLNELQYGLARTVFEGPHLSSPFRS